MKSFRNLPAIITLLAGFCVSVIMIIQKYDLVNFLWILVGTMVIFYLAGVGIRVILIKLADKKAEEKTDTEQEKETEEETDTDDLNKADDAKENKTTGK